MSYGTRKAMAGVQAGERFAHEGCEEAIRRYDACQTAADVRAVLAWCKDRGGWFLRSDDDDRRMRAAFDRARLRAAHPAAGRPEGGDPMSEADEMERAILRSAMDKEVWERVKALASEMSHGVPRLTEGYVTGKGALSEADSILARARQAVSRLQSLDALLSDAVALRRKLAHPEAAHV